MDKEFYQDLVQSVREDFDRRRDEKLLLERQWELNSNFIEGKQYNDILADGEIHEQDKDYFWQSQKVYNHIAPILEARLARLGRVRPIMSVRASSEEDSDLKCAKITSEILQSCYAKLNLDEVISKVTYWCEVTGTGFYKITWDNESGKVVSQSKNKIVHEGEIFVEAISPYEIFPDSIYHESIDACKSIIQAKAMHIDDIYQIYGQVVESENLTRTSQKTSFIKTESDLQDYALVIEKYEAPSKEYPNGRVVTVCGQTLLYIGELPYLNGVDGKRGFPFVRQICLPKVNSFFGLSVVERVIPVQRAYNAVKNRKHEFLNRISMGVITVEDGAVDVDELTEEGLYPGKVIVYRQGSNPPTLMSAGSVPNDFTYEEDLLKNEFTAVSGVSELSRSSSFSSNTSSGVALQLLIEQDDTRISGTIDNVKKAVKQVAKHIIRLYKQFATKTRVFNVSGQNKKVETYYFTNKDLTSDDVIFDTENELSYSPAQRQSAVYDLLKTGLLTDENGGMDNRTKTKLLEILGFGSIDNCRDIDVLHKNIAEAENLKFLNKVDVFVTSLDDHNIHIAEHTAFVLTRQLEGKNDLTEIMSKHILAHKQALIGG